MPGYEWHHIIEQTGQTRPDLTSEEGIRTWIQNTNNMVQVPVLKHFCVSGLMNGRIGIGVRLRDVVREHSPEAPASLWNYIASDLWGGQVKTEGFSCFSDSEIVKFFRDAALERANCGFDSETGNRIFDQNMVPAYQALVSRGPESLRELLVLIDDPSLNVRTDAAIFAYNSDPERCREALKQVLKEPGWTRILAIAGLLHMDPEFAAEFNEKAKEAYKQ